MINTNSKGKVMRLKKQKNNKTSRITFRCVQEEENAIMRKALLYTEGNLSEYILYAALNFVPSKEDFEKEKKKRVRK